MAIEEDPKVQDKGTSYESSSQPSIHHRQYRTRLRAGGTHGARDGSEDFASLRKEAGKYLGGGVSGQSQVRRKARPPVCVLMTMSSNVFTDPFAL